MEKNTVDLDRIIHLSDRLRKEWDADNVLEVRGLLKGENRASLEHIIYTLLTDLEVAAGE